MSLSDLRLDEFRLVGDPLVDEVVARYAHPSAIHPLLRELFASPGLPDPHPLVADYLEAVADRDPSIAPSVLEGQRLFQLFAPEILLVLGSYALPLAYAAGYGVQVVARARRLKDDPVRRLCDTAQMVVNAMDPGGLAPGQPGWRSTRKVRLIHALVRQHVQSDPANPWPVAWGTPINQEDQAGTLLTFSVAVLDGLRRMGARIDPHEADAYIQAWRAVGHLLGVDEALLPGDEAEAIRLAERIGTRQVRATPEGRELAAQRLEAVGTLFPLPGYAASLNHFFLESTVFGANVARVLDLPEPNWTRWLVKARAAQKRAVLGWLKRVPGARGRRSWIARRFAQAMIVLKRPDDRIPFEIPARLARTLDARPGPRQGQAPGDRP